MRLAFSISISSAALPFLRFLQNDFYFSCYHLPLVKYQLLWISATTLHTLPFSSFLLIRYSLAMYPFSVTVELLSFPISPLHNLLARFFPFRWNFPSCPLSQLLVLPTCCQLPTPHSKSPFTEICVLLLRYVWLPIPSTHPWMDLCFLFVYCLRRICPFPDTSGNQHITCTPICSPPAADCI